MRKFVLIAVVAVACGGMAWASGLQTMQQSALCLLASVPVTLGLKMSVVVALLVLAADRLLAGPAE